MKLKNAYLLTLLLLIFSCNNRKEKESISYPDPVEVVWIEVADTLHNFESLLSTNHLYYLGHMSVDYDNFGKVFWKHTDTTQNNDWTLKRHRKGACKTSIKSPKSEFCIEQQVHTINKKLNKVINFSGNGSGYFANIDFIYDESGKLLEYRDMHSNYYLKYNEINQLTEVLKMEINNGIARKTKVIKFKKTQDK